MPLTDPASFPQDDTGFGILHEGIAAAFAHGLSRLGESLAFAFGENAAHAAIRSLVIEACVPDSRREEVRTRFDQLGWREYLDTEADQSIDTVELTQSWRDAAEYAAQGLAPRELFDSPASLEDRETRVRALVARAAAALDNAALIFGDHYLYIWRGVVARKAIDFGGTVTAEGLQLLSGVSAASVRNAINAGELHPDAAGHIAADEARAWLARRRDFCPSRWKNPADDQWPRNPHSPPESDRIQVPQDADGVPFTPEHVVRPARIGTGISITVGAKGSETQYRDFYEALAALKGMEVARWRRRNSAGNWGIVRARGAWVAVSRAEIDRQLAEKRAEVA